VVIVINTLNVAMWAFRPNDYSTGRLARRWKVGIMVTWAIALPAAGAVALVFGGTGGVVTGAVALAAWQHLPTRLTARTATQARPSTAASARRAPPASSTAPA